MNKRLFVFDVDCTLLPRGFSSIPESAIESVNALLANGDVVAIDSGRPFNGIKPFLDMFSSGEKYAISVNGAALFDNDGKALSFASMSWKVLKHFYDKFSKMDGVDVYAYDDDEGLITYEESKWSAWELAMNHMKRETRLLPSEAPSRDILKVMICAKADLSSTLEFTDEEKETYHIVRSDPEYIEVLPKEVNKALQIETLRNILGIEKDDVFTFGDAGNDLEMIERYEGVAMGEATPEIKKVAKYQTRPSYDNGIEYAIRSLLKAI